MRSGVGVEGGLKTVKMRAGTVRMISFASRFARNFLSKFLIKIKKNIFSL